MKLPEPRKLPSGNYFIQLRLGGESIPVTEPNRVACIREARAIKAEYLAGKRAKAAPEAPTLTEATDAYIEERSNTLSPLTIRGYRTVQKHRFQTTMPRRLDQIDAEEWQGIVNMEAVLCAPKTLKTAFAFVRGVVEHTTGVLSMARAMHPDSAGSQFFIMVAPAPHLDGQYAAFGQVTGNVEEAIRISEVPTDWNDKPKTPVVIQSIRVDTQGVDYPEPEKR